MVVSHCQATKDLVGNTIQYNTGSGWKEDQDSVWLKTGRCVVEWMYMLYGADGPAFILHTSHERMVDCTRECTSS